MVTMITMNTRTLNVMNHSHRRHLLHRDFIGNALKSAIDPIMKSSTNQGVDYFLTEDGIEKLHQAVVDGETAAHVDCRREIFREIEFTASRAVIDNIA